MSLASMMDCSASAYRPAIGTGALGGTTQDFTPGDPGVTTLFSGIACSLQPPRSSVAMLYAQRGQECDFEVVFMQDPGDLVNCLLVVKRLRIGDTIKLNPLGTADPQQMGQTFVWKLDAKRVRQP